VEKLKTICLVCFFLASVFSLSGCLDLGLNLMAKRDKEQQEELAAEEEINKQEVEGNKEDIFQELPEEKNIEKAVDHFFEELRKLIEDINLTEEESEQTSENSEENDESNENENLAEEEAESKNLELEKQADNKPIEENLTSCDQVDLANCNFDFTVCAKVKLKTGETEETSWLEFENSCQACQNSFQEMENGTLEIIGFKRGECSLP
jgi:hypothetical protein